MDINEEIAGNIRAARAKANITQAELAERVGVSEASVVAYENAATKVSFPTACAIAEELGVSPDYLAGWQS